MTNFSTDHLAAITDPRSGRYTLDDPRYGVAIVAFMHGEPRVLGYLTQTAVRAMPAAAIDDFERECWRAFLGIDDKKTLDYAFQVVDVDSFNAIKDVLGGSSHTPGKLILTLQESDQITAFIASPFLDAVKRLTDAQTTATQSFTAFADALPGNG